MLYCGYDIDAGEGPQASTMSQPQLPELLKPVSYLILSLNPMLSPDLNCSPLSLHRHLYIVFMSTSILINNLISLLLP